MPQPGAPAGPAPPPASPSELEKPPQPLVLRGPGLIRRVVPQWGGLGFLTVNLGGCGREGVLRDINPSKRANGTSPAGQWEESPPLLLGPLNVVRLPE